MNKIKKVLAAIGCALCLSAFPGCGSGIPKNTVFSIDDLKGKTIGVQLETVGDAYASDIEGASVERFNKGADAIQALNQGNVDAVIIDIEPAKVFVSNNKGIKILDETFAEEEYAIAVSKDNTALTDKINNALDTLTANGTLDKIKANWIGDKASGQPYVFPDTDDDTPANGTLIMGTNAEFPPYELMIGEDVAGFDIDMMKAVCMELNMELEVCNMEFDTILNAVAAGNVDVGVAGITVTDERMEIVDFSKPYTTATQVVIVREK